MNTRSQYLHLILLILCGWQLLLGDVFADDKVAAVNSSAPISLAPYFAILEDPSRGLTLADIQKPEVASRFHTGQPSVAGLNFSYSRSAFWLRLTVRNEYDTPLEQMLEVGKARLSSVRFYQPTSNESYQSAITGDLMPFSTRPYKNRFFVFPVTLPPHAEQVLYLRIQSDSAIFIPARLWSAQAFHAYERNDYLTQALYFGIALAMILFNLLLFIALRDVIYLRYVVFVIFMVLAIAAQNGLIKEFFWFDSLLFSRLSAGIAFALAQVGFMMFMRHMLKIRETMPRIDRWLKALIGLQLILSVGYVISVLTFAMPGQVLHLANMLIIMSIGLYCAFKRQRSAYFFVAAFGILFVSGVITSLAGLGLLPANAVSMNALQFGSAMEMLLLAFALADRFIVIRREKETAQQQLVETLQSSERVLEERVEQRTAELQTLNEDLEKAESEQRLFMAMVSHEVRSPLAVIDSAAQVLSIKLPAENDTTPVLARIRRGVSRLTNFLDNCLTEDRLDSSGLTVHSSAINLDELAAAVKDSAQNISGEHHLITEVEANLPQLNADPQLLRILLLNLLGNAIKYSQAGSEITLCIKHAGNICIFEVADHGCGISEEELPLVFQKYKRGRAAEGIPGAGLGLSLVSRIVELHGGTIEVKSREGDGSLFVVRIPFAATEVL